MPDKAAFDPRRGSISLLAERQHGVVTAAQLYSLGLSRDQVSRRAANGWLHRVHRGVYAVGHRNLSGHGRWLAAVLAVGGDAALSHEPAARLWRLRGGSAGARPGSGSPPSPGIDVTLPGQRGAAKRAGIRIHRCSSLSPGERTERDGIPVTTPARTLLDLALVLPRRQLERAIDEAERLRLCSAGELRGLHERHRGRAGTALVAAVLDEHAAGSTATRSELEERFLGLCRERGLPRPQVNARLLSLTVDFFWPPVLVVEVDGAASHLTRRAFQDDRDRDSLLEAHGYRVLRFTWLDVTQRAGVVAHRVLRVLRGNEAG